MWGEVPSPVLAGREGRCSRACDESPQPGHGEGPRAPSLQTGISLTLTLVIAFLDAFDFFPKSTPSTPQITRAGWPLGGSWDWLAGTC